MEACLVGAFLVVAPPCRVVVPFHVEVPCLGDVGPPYLVAPFLEVVDLSCQEGEVHTHHICQMEVVLLVVLSCQVEVVLSCLGAEAPSCLVAPEILVALLVQIREVEVLLDRVDQSLDPLEGQSGIC